MQTTQSLHFLMTTPLFAGMAERDLPRALECLEGRERHYGRGDFLLRQGDTVSAIGLVLSGRVHILREDFWGRRDLIAAVLPGQLFGEAYACAGVPAAVSVLAEEKTAVLFLDVAHLLSPCANVCSFHARLIRNLLQVTSQKNLLLNEKLSHVTRRTTREKLLSYLSQESTRQRQSEFDIPFDRQQLADYLAVDRSAMSAELGKLQREGFLAFHKNHFLLRRPPEL